MKVIVVALTLVVMSHAFDFEDIPPHMKDRLDHFIALRQQWTDKWLSMSPQEQKLYETVLLARLDNLPQLYFSRVHDKIAALSEEHRVNLLNFMRRRFPKEDSEQTFENEMEEIDSIVLSLPDLIRDRLDGAIESFLQKASPYTLEDIDTEMDFPDVPELIEIPNDQEAAAFSGQMQDDLRNRVDEFLLKREDWKRKWEQLSDEKRALFESYINKK